MYINCFLVLMILSQNILPSTEAKPYFTKIHRLNSVRDFDDVIDWTQNVKNHKQEPKGSQETLDYPTIRERSVTSEASEATSVTSIEISKRSDGSTQADTSESAEATERMATSDMPSPPSKGEQKEEKKRSEVEEIKDVMDENEDNTEEFGEGISNLYKRMRNKMKKKKCKTCLEEEGPIKLEDLEDDYRNNVKYILPYRRSAPLCLLNERSPDEFYQPAAAVPVVQPVWMSAPPVYVHGSPNEKTGLYEVQWLQNFPVACSSFRKRRGIENSYPQNTYSFVVDRACDHNEKISQAQKELVCMIRAVRNEFLNKNNLTFLPILFVPHSENSKPCPDLSGSPELGQLTFQNVENDQCRVPEKELTVCPDECHSDPQCKANNSSCINIGHMTIILLVNNTLSVVFPGTKPEMQMPPKRPPQQQMPTICLQQQPPQPPPLPPICCVPCPEQNYPFKRNVIDNLKQYLENAFNFIDIRRVLTEDEVHDRNSRDAFKHFGSKVIPGILLYPKRYGPTLAKCSREAKNCDNPGNSMDYYYFTTSTKAGGSKVKRSLETRKSGITEGDIAGEEAQLEIEKKQAQLEKEMQQDLTLDKEVVEALNVGSSTPLSSSSDQMKKDEEYLEKENQEMIHNEQLLEGPDTDSGGEPTEQTCVFTEPLITEVIEPISAATDTVIETMSVEASALAEKGGNPDEAKGPDAEELGETNDALTEPNLECDDSCPPEEPCPPEPCQPDDEPCPPPCNECPPPCHVPTSDEIGLNQTVVARESKTKMSKSIAEFEDEMRGIINNSKKASLANEEKRKGVFDITTKSSTKIKKKRKSKRLRCCRACPRTRRDVGATNPSSSGWKDVTTTVKATTRDDEPTELMKVTQKETTSPVALCEEVEDVTEVLFTTKPNQEQMEMECNEVKGGFPSAKATTQKLGEPVTIVITKSTEAVSTSTEVPPALSEYIQPPLRDENDEAVTETLIRLLRDLRLVNKVQNILAGIKATDYEIKEAVKRKSERSSPNDIGELFARRKLFSMEIHQKAAEDKGSLKSFRKRTYRRRSGGGFKRYTRTIKEKNPASPENENLKGILEGDVNKEQLTYIEGSSSNKKKRWKDYAGNWVEWIPNVEPFLEPNYQNYQF